MSFSGSPLSRQVDEQDARAGRDRQGLDRVAQAALVHLLRRPAVLDRDRAEQLGRRLVGDEGGERVAERSRARSVEGRVHGVTCPSSWFAEGPGGRSAGVRDRSGSPGRRSRRCRGRAVAAADQIVGIGDHRGEVGIGRAAVIGAGADRRIRCSAVAPVRAAGHARASARLATTRTEPGGTCAGGHRRAVARAAGRNRRRRGRRRRGRCDRSRAPRRPRRGRHSARPIESNQAASRSLLGAATRGRPRRRGRRRSRCARRPAGGPNRGSDCWPRVSWLAAGRRAAGDGEAEQRETAAKVLMRDMVMVSFRARAVIRRSKPGWAAVPLGGGGSAAPRRACWRAADRTARAAAAPSVPMPGATVRGSAGARHRPLLAACGRRIVLAEQQALRRRSALR